MQKAAGLDMDEYYKQLAQEVLQTGSLSNYGPHILKRRLFTWFLCKTFPKRLRNCWMKLRKNASVYQQLSK